MDCCQARRCVRVQATSSAICVWLCVLVVRLRVLWGGSGGLYSAVGQRRTSVNPCRWAPHITASVAENSVDYVWFVYGLVCRRFGPGGGGAMIHIDTKRNPGILAGRIVSVGGRGSWAERSDKGNDWDANDTNDTSHRSWFRGRVLLPRPLTPALSRREREWLRRGTKR
jgi:hypothetical protein